MQLSQRPRRITRPWAANAGGLYTRTVPDAAPTGTTGAASYEKGFPPETFQPTGSGGVPPSGQDMNGGLFDVTGNARWLAAGGVAVFDATFAAAVGGYPRLALLASASTAGKFYQSTVDNNATDPDSGGSSGWSTVIAPVSPSSDPNVTYFPDGTIDQRGEVALSSTGEPVVGVNLIVPLTSAFYNVQLTGYINDPSVNADTWPQLIRNSRSTTGFNVQYQHGPNSGATPRLDGFTWRVVGR